METFVTLFFQEAAIAQLGERQTEGLKVPGSIPGLGMSLILALGPPGAATHLGEPCSAIMAFDTCRLT